eukprot:233489-Pyramimonas_sp.AAC.1
MLDHLGTHVTRRELRFHLVEARTGGAYLIRGIGEASRTGGEPCKVTRSRTYKANVFCLGIPFEIQACLVLQKVSLASYVGDVRDCCGIDGTRWQLLLDGVGQDT